MEGQWKFLGEGGVLKANILEAKYEAKLEFSRSGGGGGGVKQKPSMGENGYFLELHNRGKMHLRGSGFQKCSGRASPQTGPHS